MSNEPISLRRPGHPPTEREAIRWYVGAARTGEPVQFVSSYYAVLGDARGVTRRDKNGRVIPNADVHAVCWIGAMAYLAFLDQVGTALTLKGLRRKPKRGSPIEWCLRDFAPAALSARDRAVIYAFRCSLAHNYSLFNRDTNRKRPRLDFHFALNDAGPLVNHARRRWDGNCGAEPRASSRTTVNLRALGDLAEGCHQNIQAAFRDGRLVTRLTATELVLRYTIGIFTDIEA